MSSLMLQVQGKHICFLSVSHPMYGLGGAEIQTYNYAKEFLKNNWKVDFLTIKKIAIQDFNNVDIGVYHYKVGGLIIEFLSFFFIFLKIKPDYVFYRHHKYTIGILYILSLLFSFKIIWSLMSDIGCERNATSKYLDLSKRKKNFIIKYIKEPLFNLGAKKSHFILCQNDFQVKRIKEVFKRKAFKVYNSDYPTSYETERKPIALFVGSFRKVKKPEIFCGISNQIDGLKFILIGENYADMKCREKMVKIIQNSNVTYLGKKSPDKVKEILKNAMFLINTSDFEGFPNTFVLALLRGVPIISLNVNPDKILTKKRIGIHCNGDIKKMVNEINRLVKDTAQWRNISFNAFAFSNSNLNIEITTKLVINKIS